MSWRRVILLSSLLALVLLCSVKQKIFMQESDASNFLKRRGKRSPKSRDEVNEQEERTREAVEQWRQWHYDGLYPSYLYNRQNI
ncbi:unique cartilage matrix-associated protein isoform d precursor [Mus musculus]|uniref:Isoform 4 of Unique cartilage matrix-associated protein n=1 Tax=Mus musculus TaxID=10090 RepID=Q14BU0-4|nr:unique cartilage matrix-associated protein isoform d precursor [Mus musculus]ACO35747.1 upper zone of growth plate and cartilage-associated/Gla rich protein transcript variant 4 [Mus musculus]|eukprot:NP_001298137.1 unique cartilage matrix-associated protein isoform d precursor [Mus musculus]